MTTADQPIDDTPVELYRVQVSFKRGASSWGSTKIYEDRETMERDLLPWLIEARADAYDRTNDIWRACRAWAKAFFNPDDEDAPTATRVRGVEKLVNGRWLAMDPKLVPPHLEWL